MKTAAIAIAVTLSAAPLSVTLASQQTQPAPVEHARAKTPEPVTGELLTLNPDTKTLVVKTNADTEVKFSYSDTTEIIGADKGASGLATTHGATVTVHYDVHGTANIATKIEVHPKDR
ncbi:MAG TPA: hypothetical protein VEC39_17235 [Vicinamibacterales bacterium]|nr:hypothetical protein [Vicinamibacterales bacterium]